MKIIKEVLKLIRWFINEQDKLCPHCGYYCTGKTVYCLPPLEPFKTEQIEEGEQWKL